MVFHWSGLLTLWKDEIIIRLWVCYQQLCRRFSPKQININPIETEWRAEVFFSKVLTRNKKKYLAQEIAWRYRDQAVDVDRSAAETFHIILDLMNYFDM